ncbi:MAG: RloB family protein [Bacteroidales bacterium]|nr:RloB family protein [Bacteroidales bacterium]
MRKRKSFTRVEGVRSDLLFAIATEGKDTERVYFEALRDKLQTNRIRLEILPSEENDSGPESVFNRLKSFEETYDTSHDDQLWVVVDRDKWSEKILSEIALFCSKSRNFFLGLSNPCFELWLLLHREDVSVYDEKTLEQLKANKKLRKGGDTWLKRKMRAVLGSYSESSYDAKMLLGNVDDAIARGKKMDVDETQRWPQTVGTRVYRLVKNILTEAKNSR